MERVFKGEDRRLDIELVTHTVRNELRPHFAPQAFKAARVRARYSDTNFRLLMAIIEAVTGKPLGRVYEDMLFRPLGLHHTWLPGHPPLDPTPLAATPWVGGEPMDKPLVLASLGDLYSTVDDTILFLRALLGGDAFDDEATSRLMQERWNRFGFPLDRTALRLPPWPIEYGLGMMRFRASRFLNPFRPVPAVVGHTGSTGSWLFHAPELDLFLSGTVDQATAGAVPFRLAPQLIRAFQSALDSRGTVATMAS